MVCLARTPILLALAIALSPVQCTPEPALDCAEVNNVAYRFGGTTGPCGPNLRMEVYWDGTVVYSGVEEPYPDASGECIQVFEMAMVPAADAQSLIGTVCEDYAFNYEPPMASCEGAFRYVELYNDSSLLADTENLSCENSIPSATTALNDFKEALGF